MLNTYYDFKNESKFTPYIGLGFGVARLSGKVKNTTLWENGRTGQASGVDIHSDDKTVSDSDYNFAFSLGAGASYELAENWSLDAGARYFNYGTMKKSKASTDNRWLSSPMTFDCDSKSKVDGFDLSFGVRYTF